MLYIISYMIFYIHISIYTYIIGLYWIVEYMTQTIFGSKILQTFGFRFHRVTGFATRALEHQASQVDLPPLVASRSMVPFCILELSNYVVKTC